MTIESLTLPEVKLITPDVFGDDRGYFLETWQIERYSKAGLPEQFVQDNESFSQQGVLRGLHYQLRFPQGKLVRVIRGEVFDVAVDIRSGSPTFSRWVGVHLDSVRKQQIFIPPGFAHGYCVLSENAVVAYKTTELYHPEDDHGILWNDPAIGVDWPVPSPSLSAKDQANPLLNDAERPQYTFPV